MAGPAPEESDYFLTEIGLLKSMFGDTVTDDVMNLILISCNGNVNQAADAIINIVNEQTSFDCPIDNESMSLANESPSLIKEGMTHSNDPPLKNPYITNLLNESTSCLPETTSQETSNEDRIGPQISTTMAKTRQVPSPTDSASQEIQTLTTSFSEAFRSTGAIRRTTPSSKNTRNTSHSKTHVWPDQVKRILSYHNEGARTLVLMRGAPGCGKTYLARQIVDCTVGASNESYTRHIFSTDSYFMRGGVYQFNKNQLSEAHMLNQRNVCMATNKGVSPVIVDNTNTEIWELEPYVRDGVRNGYYIEVCEPNTYWAKNPNQLTRKNIHNVPRENIIRMLDRYENIPSGAVLKTFRLLYPMNKKPPIQRNIPAIPALETPSENSGEQLKIIKYDDELSFPASSSLKSDSLHLKSPDSPKSEHHKTSTFVSELKDDAKTDTSDVVINPQDEMKLQRLILAQQQIENYEKVEKDWDNGESWDTITNNNEIESQDNAMALDDPKSPRIATKFERLIEPANICNDWSKISMFMTPWQDEQARSSVLTIETEPVQTQDKSTCIEIGDLNNFKTVTTHARIITEGMHETENQVRRLKLMLDKSTSTHENDILVNISECEHKEQHFKAFCRMFKTAPRHELREIFDTCKSDVNWAVNLILDNYPEWTKNYIKTDDASDPEDEPIVECQCLAAYNIIPDVTSSAPISPVPEISSQTLTPMSQKKPKRDNKISETSLELKRRIESNVMISDIHYSQHYLNLRRRRDNNTSYEQDKTDLSLQETKPEDVLAVEPVESTTMSEEPSTSTGIVKSHSDGYDFPLIDLNESDTESESYSDTFDQLVTVNLGSEFLKKLDELFGRKEFRYPENIQPTVSLPMSILRQINAHWAMSVSSQMDVGFTQTEQMIKQDEEFARQLLAKEKELSKDGKEPEVPSLKEIMDMELAYSIYEKNVAEWRHNEPQDIAARLSREKLYNLFPELSKDVLSEVLMAHEYNFKSTVESLLISTSQENWLEDEKGIEKFVMNKEMERKQRFLENENKGLSEVEWPFLSDTDKPVNLDTVNYYRTEAQKYLTSRNNNFEKARQYFARNIPYAATFYSEIAALHTKKYEQSSSLAAAYLMNYHLKNNPDKDVVDLHYLRVPEAMVNLDLFLDQIILKLRTKNINSQDVWVITGKGTHSVGGPRIKPAAKRRLKARDIPNKLVNGGLLMAQILPTHKMTNEIEALQKS